MNRVTHISTKLWRTATKLPLFFSVVRGQGHARSDNERLCAAADWLLEAQKAVGGGGYAHSFNFLYGWQPPYPETTGYIAPTLLDVYEKTGITAYRDSIAVAMRWLRSIQRPDGSFADLQGRPQVFDTGQILIGFNSLVQRAPDLCDHDALAGAARWLCSIQEKNGCFIRHAYNAIPHSYYARVGAALAVAGRVLGDNDVREAGIANLRWTVSQQEANGFFRHLSFDESPPFLHTMVYVIEGLLDGAEELADASLLTAALEFAGYLSTISRNRDGILRSQYTSNYVVANPEKCLTGLAQWAAVCFRLARRLNDQTWCDEGAKSLDFVKKRQILSRNLKLNGGVPGSAPFHGRYMRAAIPNWGVKFFIDALLEENMTSKVSPP